MHLFSGVFQNFDVDFWPLLKAEKVLAPEQFWRKKTFSSKFSFLSSIRIYKLSASRITENSSHCYTLTYNVKTLPSDEEPGEGAMVLGAMPEV